jgi:hypothetical protein
MDVLEPYDDSRTDTWVKTIGRAKFAGDQHMEFGRLMFDRIKDGKTLVIDAAESVTRETARNMQSASDLDALVEDR